MKYRLSREERSELRRCLMAVSELLLARLDDEQDEGARQRLKARVHAQEVLWEKLWEDGEEED